ncbi:hypothetical protein [Pseudoalteromonas rubra]|uniref:Outer membrane protein beta-barrel domain-containing protein n=1 Tax=Pseudoalteromonas rubra TaxID=43658 RepID=A0A5S3X2C3_9GAMM|nr:hypothetical protein [Pseudoalteromonas rubra]TMP38468.1 hypothetical protein CWB98_06985 [Pseudoalteromonas rubra]
MRSYVWLALGLGLFSGSAMASNTGFGVTLYGGQSSNQDLHTSQKAVVELADKNHFGVSFDRYLDKKRYGFFYSMVETEFEDSPIYKVDMEYLMFQSAIDVDITDNLDSYIGAQIGVNKVTPNFEEPDHFFAAGFYGGLKYDLGAGFSALTELRWLASSIKNSSKVRCDGSDEDVCAWHFDGDVLNQFQLNVGLTYRF